jgi:hypothetical protein
VKIAIWIAVAGLLPCWLLAGPGDDLVEAARNGNLAAVQALVAAGTDPNAPNAKEACALNAAAASDEPEMVKWLLAHGANPNQHSKCGEYECRGGTPLSEAARIGSVEIARMLLAAGADIAAEDDLATQLANLNGRVEAFKFLKATGGREWPEHPVVHLGLPRAARPPGSDVATDIIDTPASTRLLPSKPASVSKPKKRSRLAVIADAPNAAAGDLVFAELLKAPELELVERAELNRIISEQKLSLAFATNPANGGRVGELLKADALLLISARKLGDKDVVETRLLRTNPGLVLDAGYRAAPMQGIAEWAADLAARVRAFAPKALAPKAIALSVVNFRASVGNASGRALESALPLLLAERLVQKPGVYVMERSELDRLIREQPVAEASGFWTAAWIIDGTIDLDLDGSGGFAATAFLHPSDGGAPVTLKARGNAREIAPFRENLAQQIMRTVAGSAPVSEPFAARDEAGRFLREARWALDCGLPRLAHRAAETAWALGDHSTESARVRLLSAAQFLTRNHADVRRAGEGSFDPYWKGLHSLHDPYWSQKDGFHHPTRQLEWPGAGEIFDVAIQSLETYRAVLDDLGSQDEAVIREWLAIGDKVLRGALAPATLIDTAGGRIEHAERLQQWRETWKPTLEQMIALAETIPERAEDHAGRFALLAGTASFWVRDPTELFPVYRDLLKRGSLADPATVRRQIRSAILGSSLGFNRTVPGPGGGDHASPAGTRRLWKIFARDLQQSNVPEDALVGWILEKRSQPTEDTLRHTMDKLWELRGELAREPDNVMSWFYLASLVGDRHEVFVKDTSAKKDLGAEVVAFRRKYFIALCRESPTLILGCAFLVTNTPGAAKAMDPGDREELRAEIEAHLARESTRQAAEDRSPGGLGFYKYGGFAYYKSRLRALVEEPADPLKPLEITRLWEPPQSKDARSMQVMWGQEALWAEGRVWLYCEDRSGRGGVFAIEPETMQHISIDLPNPESAMRLRADWKAPTPKVYFDVTPKQIVLTRSSQYLAVYDRAAQHWQFFEDIAADGFPVILGDDCYFVLTTPDSSAVACFNLTTRKMQLIASTRRVPSESPLDDPSLVIASLAGVEDGQLLIRSYPKQRGNAEFAYTQHLWSPAAREWREKPGARATFTQPLLPGFSRQGSIYRTHPEGGSLPYLEAKTNPNHYLTGPWGRVDVRFPRIGPNHEWRPLVWGQCPQGIVLPIFGGSRGFWFVPQKELDEYTAKSLPNHPPDSSVLPGATRPQIK